MRRLATVLFLFAVTSSLAHPQGIRFHRNSREVIEKRLSSGIGSDVEREARLRDLFKEAGCANVAEAPVKGERIPNVICTVPGAGDKVIVLGAHFDHVSAGDGIVDNWSGASLLPSIVESLNIDARRHTLVFIGFTAEEKGLVGSEAYVKSLSKEERARISAMINLDTLGLSPTKVWVSHSDPKLIEHLARVAATMKLPVAGVNVENVGSADSESFRTKKIPTITIHSVTQNTLKILHSSDDRLKSIQMDDYYQSYMLISGFLAFIDENLDKPSAPATSN